MRYDGQYVNVKRMGLALDGLIRSEYPGDFLQFIEMFTFAKPRHVSEVPGLMPKPVTIYDSYVRLKADMSDPDISELQIPPHFTNIQHAMQLGRRYPGRKDTPNRQMVIITDGLPTAHFEGKMLYLLYPPDPRTEDATMREAMLCAKEGITINIFLLQSWNQSEEDVRFAYRMAETTKGRVIFTAGRDLDRFRGVGLHQDAEGDCGLSWVAGGSAGSGDASGTNDLDVMYGGGNIGSPKMSCVAGPIILPSTSNRTCRSFLRSAKLRWGDPFSFFGFNPMGPIASPLILFCLLATDEKPAPKLPIGKETTYFTGPLDSNGYVNYVAALNDRLSRGITPDTNANVLIWKAIGPTPDNRKMPAEYFKWLGIEEPPPQGDYLINLEEFGKNRLNLDKKRIRRVDRTAGAGHQEVMDVQGISTHRLMVGCQRKTAGHRD